MPIDVDASYEAHFREIETRAHDALAASGFDTVVIHSGSHVLRSTFDDQDWPLRPVPAFNHFIHWPSPDAFLVLSQGARTRLGYVERESFWEASFRPDLSRLERLLEPEPLKSREAARGLLPPGRAAFVGQDVALSAALDLGEPNPAILLERLEDARVEKTEFEIAALRVATQRAVEGHRAAEKAFMAGERSELALHLVYLGASNQDAFDTPYQNIVALGEAAATLHYIQYQAAAKSGARSFLLDAGATHEGYASDITRTHVQGGDGAADEFAALVRGLERGQQALIASIRVGEPFEGLHDNSHERLAGLLLESGIAKKGTSAEALVESRVTRAFYPHGLGHSLGIQTHDVGCRRTPPAEWNPFLRNTRTIAPGQVFTIEPGLYFIESLLGPVRSGPHKELVDWSKVDALKPFGGIRIEDNVVVRAQGVENLTRDAFGAAQL